MGLSPKQNSKSENHSFLDKNIYENFDGINQEMLPVRAFLRVARDCNIDGHPWQCDSETDVSIVP